ncbi:MAG: hypothetical protein LBV30_04305 [Propionibacteriaceae bacterium]|jgi:hypothetical protein|nr:hypothetical protein [Propionibacteriaceae bacterium]
MLQSTGAAAGTGGGAGSSVASATGIESTAGDDSGVDAGSGVVDSCVETAVGLAEILNSGSPTSGPLTPPPVDDAEDAEVEDEPGVCEDNGFAMVAQLPSRTTTTEIANNRPTVVSLIILIQGYNQGLNIAIAVMAFIQTAAWHRSREWRVHQSEHLEF